MKNEERIRCPVHDLISFKRSRDEDVLLWNLIQTQPMQRLRRIKQLGFCEFVYPGATHSRFSHALGAMHMARRMLDVLAKNQSLGEGENFVLDRRATLAAALLHDVGHGPYSHVFEEISDHFDLGRDHETYTLELLDVPEIKDDLVKFDVYEQTRKFFTEEPGYNIFNAIISSQMDCDRLDFLCRDRHHTGIRSDAIDLEWLFDSLRIEKVPVGPVPCQGHAD
jgi:HD superfamily phosphohydrolase